MIRWVVAACHVILHPLLEPSLARYRETRNHAAVVGFTLSNCSILLIDTVTINALQCIVIIDKGP